MDEYINLDGTSNGWHRNPTMNSRWMSTKIAPTINIGEWGEPSPNPDRGPGILKVTTTPTVYITVVNDITPSYRILKESVISESNVNKVIVGDIIENDYFHYPVLAIVLDYAYLGERTSIRGSKGDKGDTGTARILSSLDETGYQDEVGIYKGRVYVYNEGWHIANTDSYLGSYNTIPPFQLDAFFYCSSNFILDNALLKTKDGKYVVTKSGQYLTVKKQFEKDFIYLCTNEGWIKVSDKKDYRYIIAMQDKLTATGELPASIDGVVQDKADKAESSAKEFSTTEAENAKNKAIEESSKYTQSQLQAKVGTYLGMKTESPSSASNGDYFLLNNQDYADDNGYLFKYDGTWKKLEPDSENYLLYMTALKDVMSITNAPVGAFSTLFANILMANSAVIGQLQTQVISLQNGGCIQSSNYNTARIEVLDADSFEWVSFSDNCRGIRILKWGESEETIEYFQTTSTSSTPPYYNIYYYPVVVFDNNPDTVITVNDETFSSYTQKSDAKYLHIAYRVTSRGDMSISSQQTFDTNLLYGEIGFKIDDTGKAKFNSDVYIGGNSIIGGNTTIKGFIDNNQHILIFRFLPAIISGN